MKKYIIYSLSMVLGLSSCSLKESPTSYYETDSYFTDESKAAMAVIGAYSDLSTTSHYGQFEMAMPSSDDTYYINGTGTDNTRRDISHYMVNSTNTWIRSLWQLKYACIDRANLAIQGIEKMPGYSENANLKRLVAEARFLRAFLGFDLIKYWGDVPFKTTPSVGYGDAFQPRTDREEIYDIIIEDLNFAKDNLPMADASTSPEKPCQGAAHALLMRIYLQRAGYSLGMDGSLKRPDDALRKTYFSKAVEEYEKMQEKGFHGFYPGGYEALFKSFSAGVLSQKESLWEIAFSPTGNSYEINSGTWGTYNGPLVAAPASSADSKTVMGRANAFFRVMPAWKNFFEDADERRDVMVCTYQYKWSGGQHVKTENKKMTDWYPGKWRREWMPLGFVNPNNVYVNYCPLRYSDVVLMAAEAYNETGNSAKAWELINSVRERAGASVVTPETYSSVYKAPKVYDLPFIDDSDEAGKIRTALYWERGFELAFEGQRKYDLIRWGILAESLKLAQDNMDASLKGKYVAGEKFVKGQHELFPLPLDEMQSNPKITQNNPGY